MLIIILGMGIGMYASMFDFMGTRETTMEAVEFESRFMDFQVSTQYGVLLDRQLVEDMLMDSPVRDGILAVEYRMRVDVYINHTVDDQEKMTKGVMFGYDFSEGNGESREILVNNPLFFDDKVTDFSVVSDPGCYLEVNFAHYYGITPEDEFDVVKDNREFNFVVYEIINVPDYFDVITGESMFPAPDSLGAMVVPIELCYEVMGLDSSSEVVNDFVLRITEDADVEIIEEELERLFEEASIPVSVIRGEDNPAWASLMGDLEGDRAFMGMFPGIIFIISGIGLVIALRRMVRAHRPQIGIFKALGVPNKTVMLYFLNIGLIIAGLSMVLGYALSLPLKILFNGLMDEMLLFAVREYATYSEYYVYAGIIALVLCIACTLLPAGFAVREKPVDVIQKREGLGRKKSKAGHQHRLSRRFPVPIKMVGRDISRKPVRSLTTIFGVALSLALFLSVVIMFDSFFVFLDNTKAVNSWDYEVSVSGFTPNSYAASWTDEFFYVDYANPGLRLPINVSENGVYVDGLIYGLHDLSRSLDIGVEYPFGDGVFISGYMADELGVAVGDFVEVEVFRFDESFQFSMFATELEVLGIHNNPIGAFVYADIGLIYRLTGLDGLSNFYLLHTEGLSLPRENVNAIAQTENVVAVTFVGDQNTFIDQMFDLIMGFIFLMILISVVLAVAIVYNLFKIGAIEKSRDYATMKTLGTSMRRISYLIFFEAVVTLVGGLTLGALGGYFMSYAMLMGNELLEGIALDIVFSWTGLAMGAVMLTGVVVLVSWLTIRFIRKINIADVIRDRSSG